MAKQSDSVVRFTVDDDAFEVDAERLTLGETAAVESHFDCDFSDLHGTQATLALVYIAMRRRKPAVSWSEVEAIEIRQIGDEKPKRPTKTPARSGSQS